MLLADRLRVYHSLQSLGTCRLEVVLIRYLPTSSEFITHRKNVKQVLGGEVLSVEKKTYTPLDWFEAQVVSLYLLSFFCQSPKIFFL